MTEMQAASDPDLYGLGVPTRHQVNEESLAGCRQRDRLGPTTPRAEPVSASSSPANRPSTRPLPRAFAAVWATGATPSRGRRISGPTSVPASTFTSISGLTRTLPTCLLLPFRRSRRLPIFEPGALPLSRSTDRPYRRRPIPTKEAGFVRTNEAHDWLQRLESHLRRFIDQRNGRSVRRRMAAAPASQQQVRRGGYRSRMPPLAPALLRVPSLPTPTSRTTCWSSVGETTGNRYSAHSSTASGERPASRSSACTPFAWTPCTPDRSPRKTSFCSMLRPGG